VTVSCVAHGVAAKRSGAAGSIPAIGDALSRRGHGADVLWNAFLLPQTPAVHARAVDQ